MSESDPQHRELIDWLGQRGHSQEEIDKILLKLQQYDEQTMHESVFDSISRGQFDIASIIDEALSETEE